MLSIIITTYNARSLIGRCLDSLKNQITEIPFEIILVDSSRDGTADFVAENYPAVKLVRFDERKWCGGARNAGIAFAQGDVIAFIDADCVAAPDWVTATCAAHEQHPEPIIGGVIDNANPEDTAGWAYYFSEFSAWLPGTDFGRIREVPGCVMSIKRWAYEQYGPFIEKTYCSDSAFHWQIQAKGYEAVIDPSIRIAHTNPANFAHFLRHEVEHGRNFGEVRAREQGWSRLRRWGMSATLPVLPLLLFGRIAYDALTKQHARPFLRVAPLVLAGQIAWSYGECRGALM